MVSFPPQKKQLGGLSEADLVDSAGESYRFLMFLLASLGFLDPRTS